MAEIRKHRPRSSGTIGDQVRATIGAGPRPVVPGEEPAVVFDPFVDEAAEAASATPASAAFAVTSVDTSGWFSFGAEAVQAMVEASRPVRSVTDGDTNDDDPTDDGF